MRNKLAMAISATVAMSLTLVGCGGSSQHVRRVSVDFSSDEFGSFAFFNFPEKVIVRQGDILEFKQAWTGEPHTVTGGTLVTEKMRAGAAWLDFFEAYGELLGNGAAIPDPEDPGDATFAEFAKGFLAAEPADVRDKGVKAYDELRAAGIALPDLKNPPDQPFADVVHVVDTESDKAFNVLPYAFNDDDELAQNVSQPCYLDDGLPPEDEATPCAAGDRRQPEFDGRQSYYNSGVIPYQGTQGNTFRVRMANDAAPGSYLFYCAVHGFLQRTEVEIRPAGADIADEQDVARKTREETKVIADELGAIYEDASKDLRISIPGPGGEDVEVTGPFAGLGGKDHTGINEFVPKTIKAKRGEPITWKMMGNSHTISFNVPRYFPIMEFLKDGTVRINPRIGPAAGGAIALPEPEPPAGGEGDGPDGPVVHDGGTFDGTGFWSSGLIKADPYLEYTMRITKPGAYPYACLIHPRMIGRIEIT
jgi:plastocyanin